MGLIRKLFARKEETWKPLCDELGGQYINGGFWKGDRIELPHRDWLITLKAVSDADTSHYSTSLHCPGELDSGVKLGFMRNWPGQQLMEFTLSLFNQQKAKVSGLEETDMVLATDQAQADAILGDQRLQALMNEQPELLLFIGIEPRPSSKSRGVHLAVPDFVTDITRMKSLVALCGLAVDILSDAGLISPPKSS